MDIGILTLSLLFDFRCTDLNSDRFELWICWLDSVSEKMYSCLWDYYLFTWLFLFAALISLSVCSQPETTSYLLHLPANLPLRVLSRGPAIFCLLTWSAAITCLLTCHSAISCQLTWGAAITYPLTCRSARYHPLPRHLLTCIVSFSCKKNVREETHCCIHWLLPYTHLISVSPRNSLPHFPLYSDLSRNLWNKSVNVSELCAV